MEPIIKSRTRPMPIIHINGFPGTRKLSIARHLLKLLPEHHNIPTNLIHNHLLIDPANAVLHRTQPVYQTIRRAICSAVFTSLELETATFDTTYIFTDFQSSNALGSSICAEYAAMATKRGCALISVVSKCEEEENLRRVAETERGSTKKLTDGEVMRRFRRYGASVHLFQENPISLELDVTQLSAEEVTKLIIEHVFEVCPDLVGLECPIGGERKE